MSKPTLDVDVRELLESRRGEWTKIAEEAGVSHSWISQFVRGKIPNPGFGTLSMLHAYLTKPDQAADAPTARA